MNVYYLIGLLLVNTVGRRYWCVCVCVCVCVCLGGDTTVQAISHDLATIAIA